MCICACGGDEDRASRANGTKAVPKGTSIQSREVQPKLAPLHGHLLLHTGVRLSTAPEGSAAGFDLEVSARGALFTILGEREGWLELESWHGAPKGREKPGPEMPPACVPLARGLEVVNLAFFVERKTIDEATISTEDPILRFGCPPEKSGESVAQAAAIEAEHAPLQSGRPRIRLPAGRGTHLTEYELSAGTRLSWPDGTPAGTVLLAHRYSEAPTKRGSGHCVLAFAGESETAQLSWCARAADFKEVGYEQQPIYGRREDRARALGIIRQLGVVGADENEVDVLNALMNDQNTLDMLFEAQDGGLLENAAPSPSMNSLPRE